LLPLLITTKKISTRSNLSFATNDAWIYTPCVNSYGEAIVIVQIILFILVLIMHIDDYMNYSFGCTKAIVCS